jgi:hypothetical protein
MGSGEDKVKSNVSEVRSEAEMKNEIVKKKD